MCTVPSSTAANYRYPGIHEAAGGSTSNSTVRELSSQNILQIVADEVLGAHRPPQVEMDEILEVDKRSIGLMRASFFGRTLLPHVERTMKAEHDPAITERPSFVARTLREHPGVVHAVRWASLSDRNMFIKALESLTRYLLQVLYSPERRAGRCGNYIYILDCFFVDFFRTGFGLELQTIQR